MGFAEQTYERDGCWYPVPVPIPLADVIYGALCNALAFTDGSQKRAAALLDISARMMNHMMKVRGLPRDFPRTGGGHRRPKAVPIVALLLALLGVRPTAASAQVAQVPADPVSATVSVLPAGTDWTVPALTTRATAISATSTNCNQPPPPVVPLPIVNPTTAVFDDPWHGGKVCRVLLPAVPVGTGYRVTVQFTATPGTSCVDPTGTTPVPCLSPVARAPDPFGVAAFRSPPAAATGVALRP